MTTASGIANRWLGALDRHLLGEGRHWRLWEVLGAHPTVVDGVSGVHFGVWAPAAASVRLVGDFNGWVGDGDELALDAASGTWHAFVPGVAAGALYKFEIADAAGHVTLKADPLGFAAEVPPRTASVVVDWGSFPWSDQAWMEGRRFPCDPEKPLSIYEVHLGSWRTDRGRHNGWMNYRQLAERLVDYCREQGFTHVQLMPVSEHPYTGSWGYQTVGYFAVTSRYGSPADFMAFVDRCHAAGLGVLLDWVPAHFPRDQHGLRRFDGTALYEHLDPRRGEHPDWGTMIFNYGRNEVRNFLVANALFWLDKYHVDGLRVDAVASMLYLDYSRQEGQWLPNAYGGRENLQAIEFLRDFNRQVHAQAPGAVTIAEESTAWPGVTHAIDDGGLGFDLKWNMGWMNDTLRYLRRDPIHRRFHHNELTFSLWYAFSERFVLPLSHDEVVHGKRSLLDQMPGDAWRRFANLRLLYAYLWTHPGKKTLFMGNELAPWREWNCEHELPWQLADHEPHRGVQRWVAQLNRLYTSEPALHQLDSSSRGFAWIDHQNASQSVLVYLRQDTPQQQRVIVVCNFTPEVHRGYRIGVPDAGTYIELANSDAVEFGGSGVVNARPRASETEPHHHQPQSLTIDLPPLGASLLKLDGAPV